METGGEHRRLAHRVDRPHGPRPGGAGRAARIRTGRRLLRDRDRHREVLRARSPEPMGRCRRPGGDRGPRSRPAARVSPSAHQAPAARLPDPAGAQRIGPRSPLHSRWCGQLRRIHHPRLRLHRSHAGSWGGLAVHRPGRTGVDPGRETVVGRGRCEAGPDSCRLAPHLRGPGCTDRANPGPDPAARGASQHRRPDRVGEPPVPFGPHRAGGGRGGCAGRGAPLRQHRRLQGDQRYLRALCRRRALGRRGRTCAIAPPPR